MTTVLETKSNFSIIMSYGSIFILVFTALTMFIRKWQKEND